ncbi:MAG TPA: SDR family oxidoreductase [Actinomycetes bacterium]|nr:SDR family oxidoreductase [Actinomycetes bacterium]
MPAPPYAVTGATGQIGGRVARALAAAGAAQRLVVRDSSRAPRLPGAEVAVASYDDAEAMRSAFGGVETLFMVSGEENPDRLAQHLRCVDAAVAAGVRRIVYTSYFGAAPNATFTLARDHWATEEHIRASRLGWTFLRNNLYADFLPLMVGEDGVIRGPGGDGRVSVVARDDVGAVAARVLLDVGRHDGTTYGLTGPEALSFDEIGHLLSGAVGRPISYQDETLEEAYASRARYAAPAWQVDAWVSMYVAIAAGEMAEVTDAIPRVLGRPATPFVEVVARG